MLSLVVPLRRDEESPAYFGTIFVDQKLIMNFRPKSDMKRFILFIFGFIIIFLLGFEENGYSQDYIIKDSLNIIEKVYLHIDRESYYSGDDIWFKAYLVEATDRFLTSHSSNLHVELISPASEIIDSRIVKITGGLGNGDFHLSENLISGRYIIRAYTNYMRNFGDDMFFKKDIIIINASDEGKEFADTAISVNDKPEISFFPEGGSLVENVTSIVAFKAVDDHGFAVDVSGEIYSSAGEMVTDFKSTHFGMGSFSIKPVPGIKYFAVTKNKNGDLMKYEIPGGFSKGVILGISKNQNHKLTLTIRTNSETLPLIVDSDLSLTVSARNIHFISYSIRMLSLNSSFNLPTSELPEGIVKLTLSGPDEIPLCERLVFIQNEEDIKINIKTNKTEYKQRDSVSINVSLSVYSREQQDAFLSLSATDKLFTANSSGFPSTISSWFLLESDVHGPVEEPSYYFDPSNPNRLNDLDMLLLTQGWRDFEWKYKKMEFPPENGFTISGKVRKKFIDKPVKNSMVTIGIFSKAKPKITLVPTDSAGKFYIRNIDIMDTAKLVASVTDDKDNLRGLLLLDSLKYSPALVKNTLARINFAQKNVKFSGDSIIVNKDMHKFIQYAEIEKSIQKKYKLSDTIALGEVKIIAARVDWTETERSRSRHYLMGTPDHEFVINKQLEAYNDVYQLVAFRIKSPIGYGMHNPLYLIDGLRVPEDAVKGLPVKWVARIDVIDNAASLLSLQTMVSTGDTTYGYNDGVISIIMKSNYDEPVPAYHSINTKISGYNEPRIFFSPKHHATLESDYKPDLRTTLLWEPNIKVENNKDIILNYYNADISSTVKVIVEGITTRGIPVTATTEYEVK